MALLIHREVNGACVHAENDPPRGATQKVSNSGEHLGGTLLFNNGELRAIFAHGTPRLRRLCDR